MSKSLIFESLQGLSKLGQAINDVDDIMSSRIGGLNGYKKQNLDLAEALKDLTVEQTITALSTKDVSAAQATDILIKKGVTKETAEAAIANSTLAGSQKVATGTTLSLSAAYKGLAASLGLTTAALTGVIAGIAAIGIGIAVFNHFHESVEETAEKVDELMNEFDSLNKTAKQNKKTTEGLISRYEKLSKGVNNLGQNVSLTNEEYDEYNSLVNDIADMFPQLIQGYTDEGTAILNLKGNVEGLRDAYKEAQAEAYRLILTSGDDIFTNYNNQVYGNEPWYTKTSSFFDGTGGSQDAIDILTRLTGALTPEEFIQTYNQLYEEYKNIWHDDKIQNALESSGFEKVVDKWSDITDKDLANVKSTAQAAINIFNAEIQQQVQNARSFVDAYFNMNPNYDKLDDQAKTAASILVNSINSSVIDLFENSPTKAGVYVDKIIAMLSDDSAIKDEVIKLFTTDLSDMPLDEAQAFINSYISKMAEYLNEDENELKIRLGFDIADTLSRNLQHVNDEAIRKFNGISKQALSYDSSARDRYVIEKDALDQFAKDNSINTQEEIAFWNKCIEESRTREEAMRKYLESPVTTVSFSITDYKKQIDNFQSTVSTLGDALAKLNDGSMTDSELVDLAQEFTVLDIESKTLEQDIQSLIDNALTSLLGSIENPPEGLVETLTAIAEAAKDAKGELDNLNDTLSDLESSHNLLKTIKEDMKVGGINVSNLQKILDVYPEMELSVAKYNAGLISSQDLYDELQKKYDEDYANFKYVNSLKIAENEDYYYETLEVESDKVAELNKAYGIDLKNYNNLAQAKLEIEQKLYDELSALWDSAEAPKDVWGNEANTAADWEQFFEIKKDEVGKYYAESTGLAEYIDNRLGAVVGGIGDFSEDEYTERYKAIIHYVTSEVAKLNQVNASIDDVFANFENYRKPEFGGDDETEKSIELMDWYATAIERVEREIENFDKTVNDDNKTLEERKQALEDQIAATEKLKTINEEAATAYYEEAMKAAKEGGISDWHLGQIMNGTLNENTIDLEEFGDGKKYSLEYLESLQEVLDWYEQYLDATDAAADADAEAAELRETNLEDLFQSYDWLEKKLERIQEEYEKLDKDANDPFASFDDRISASRDKINNTISSYLPDMDKVIAGYEKEVTEAEAKLKKVFKDTGLSDEYITKIKEGAFEIEDGFTDDQIDVINNLADAWSKYNDAIQTKADFDSLPQQFKDHFDKVNEKYTNKIDKATQTIAEFDAQLAGSEFDSSIDRAATLKELANANLTLAAASLEAANGLDLIVQEMLAMGYAMDSPEVQAMLAIIKQLELDEQTAKQEAFSYEIEQFNNIIKKYEHALADFEHEAALIENDLAKAEARGYIANTKYYEQLIDNQLEEMATNIAKQEELKAELKRLEEENPTFKNTYEWNELVDEIDALTLAFEEGELTLIEYANAIRQIEWDVFDFIQEQIGQITNEADFLISLMERKDQYDDKGQLTDVGMATMGLHGLNYYSYVKDAERYAEELAEIEADIAKNGENVDTTLINRKNELIEAYRDSILAAEDSKYAIIDMVEEGINLELESLQELIDAYGEALDSQKDLYDWQKKTANQSKNIAALQKQLSAYENDKSEEARAKIQQIRVQLQEAQEEMDDSNYEHSIDEQKELLEHLYTEYEDVLNTRLDNVDELLKDMINDINQNSNQIVSTLITETGKVGTTISNDMQNIWNGVSGDLGNLNSSVGSVTDAINNNYASMESGLKTDIKDLIGKAEEQNENDKAQKESDSIESNERKETLSSIKDGVNNISVSLDKYIELVAGTEGQFGKMLETLQLIATYIMNWDASGFGGIGGGTASDVELPAEKPATTDKGDVADKEPSGKKYPSVGSNVTATGTWYEASDGTGKTGNVKLNGATSWEVEKINKGSKYPYHLISYNSKGVQVGSGWVELKQLSGYRVGTRRIDEDEYAWTQENGQEAIIRPSDGAILTPLAQYDSVLNAGATQNLWDVANDPRQFIKDNMAIAASGSYARTVATSGGTVETSMDVQFVLPNVTNYNEFVSQMQRDKKFEKMVQDMTINQLSGGTQMAKYRHKFV